MAKMTDEEKTVIIRASIAASRRGDKEEQLRYMKMLPLSPQLAMIAKEMYGKEALLATNCNLSVANEVLGDGWLDR